jgi:hypothetical protein
MHKTKPHYSNYIIILIISLILLATLIPEIGFSSWAFINNNASSTNIITQITTWVFNEIWEAGDTIIINDDGTITVNGEDIEAEISYGESQEAYDKNASVELQVVANDDGTLAIAVYNVKPNTTWLGGNSGTVYFPDSINVNGVDYPVVAIGSPVDFDSSRFILTTSYVTGVVIPEGYKVICNRAFYDCEFDTTCSFTFPSTLESIGSQIFNMARNSTFTINYNGTTT